MAQTYLLTTPDGEQVHVETSQAGETITTPSGKTVEVPRLSELKKLPPVEQEVTRPKRQWGVTNAIVLVLGLIITIIAGFYVASLTFVFYTPPEEIKAEIPQEALDMIEGDIETWDATMMIDFWAFASKSDALQQLRSNGSMERNFIETLQGRQVYKNVSIGFVVFGILVMVSSFLIPGTKVQH
ncbi:hypothetical protein [Blastopirellula marina]|uniref:Uncharacterized protein n=1 Tax=Blastopirellula marina TaxID=124 RepID=A0A2S8GP63_9BACT|nr:hypothetical protein [Blastopirellula marina]PQO46218.1 hypothetical protein C5Y93_09535 [Blastopirellula marina]